jgi:hypothetical protein
VLSPVTAHAISTTLSVDVQGYPQCSDGIDNDGDALIDFPADPECESTSDTTEAAQPVYNTNPSGSGGGGGGGGGGITATPNQAVFRGIAYPLSKVTLTKDGQVAAESLAGPDAQFEITLSGLSTGTFSFGIWSTDNRGERSVMQTYTIAVTNGVTTVISGIFLPPTITTDKVEVKLGDVLTVLGQTAPSSTINLYFHSEKEIVKNATASKDGTWVFKLDSSELGVDNHTVQSRSKVKDDYSSLSKLVAFKVGSRNILRSQAASASGGAFKRGDVNKDGKVNLIDFSILAYWYKRLKPKPEYDLNHDGVVNIIDFSIVAYDWTG